MGQAQQILFENVHRNGIRILFISFLKLRGWGGGNNPVGSLICEQWYSSDKYYKNASIRAFCFLISWGA